MRALLVSIALLLLPASVEARPFHGVAIAAPPPPTQPYPRTSCPYQANSAAPLDSLTSYPGLGGGDDRCLYAVGKNPSGTPLMPNYFTGGVQHTYTDLTMTTLNTYFTSNFIGEVAVNDSVLKIDSAVTGSIIPASHQTITCTHCPPGLYILSQIDGTHYQLSNTIAGGIAAGTGGEAMRSLTRPWWNVADVEYPTGAIAGTTFLDPATLPAAPSCSAYLTFSQFGAYYCANWTGSTGNGTPGYPLVMIHIDATHSPNFLFQNYDLSADDVNGFGHNCVFVTWNTGNSPTQDVSMEFYNNRFLNSHQCGDNLPSTGGNFSLITHISSNSYMRNEKFDFNSFDMQAAFSQCCSIPGINNNSPAGPPYFSAWFGPFGTNCVDGTAGFGCTQTIEFNRIMEVQGHALSLGGSPRQMNVFNNYWMGCHKRYGSGHPECFNASLADGWEEAFNTAWGDSDEPFKTAIFSYDQSSATIGWIDIHNETAMLNSAGGWPSANNSNHINGYVVTPQTFVVTSSVLCNDTTSICQSATFFPGYSEIANSTQAGGGSGNWNTGLAESLTPLVGTGAIANFQLDCGTNAMNPGTVGASWCPSNVGISPGQGPIYVSSTTGPNMGDSVTFQGANGLPSSFTNQVALRFHGGSGNNLFGLGHWNMMANTALWSIRNPRYPYFTHVGFHQNFLDMEDQEHGVGLGVGGSNQCQGGTIAASGTSPAGQATITLSSAPSPDWRAVDMFVSDTTNAGAIPANAKIASIFGTQITLNVNLTATVNPADNIKIGERMYLGDVVVGGATPESNWDMRLGTTANFFTGGAPTGCN